ncbi:TIGR03751 family conjugal transfer lipoprotein [Legionella drancourtii]|uniref:TIGR03751 family conjugal transfer lipoprotein n=1 Tax=Legionella drancourtii TaxID=168933 RepID=UPI00058DC002|nr:TIGR03751 family conjugal transfer lipoprotein [Legionella drancourtii]
MVTYKTIRTILVLSSLWLISSCSSSVASGNIPEKGLTVSQIYNQSVTHSADSYTVPRYRRAAVSSTVRYHGETRTAANENKVLFKTLENPAVPIYIYPHVALIGDEQLLKPGFTTEFFLYKQNQFALASERY